MSFWERFRTTVRADAHGVIDALEDRTLVLKQHLRDAEQEVQNKRGRLTALERERTRLQKDRERAASERALLDRDAELAVDEGQDELARHALQRFLPLQQLDQRIADRLEAIGEEQRDLTAVLLEQQRALSELQARVASYIAERAQQESTEGAAFVARPVEPETVELELLRRKRAQRERQEAGDAE